MNLLSSLVNGIDTKDFLGQKIGAPNALDFKDTTFSDILEREINSVDNVNMTNPLGSLGMPAGFQIQEIDAADLINAAREMKNVSPTSENDNHSNILNLAQKQAANFYKHSGGVVTGLTDFIEDALHLT